MNKIKNVAIYCRVSTEEQKKFGISVQDQKDSLTRYCKENKYKIYDYYIDEGVSAGTISKRKEFVRLLKDLDNIDLILFTRLDRFSRNVRDANNLLVELDKHNTSFRAIDDEDIDVSTSDGRFIFNLKVNLAEHERNKDSERINRVNRYKYQTAKTVCSGAKIFGYDIKDKKLIINEEEAKQVNLLFDKYIETNNISETVRWFQTNIKKVCFESIKKYLNNSAYIGQYVHTIAKTKETEIIENFCPAIMTTEKFNKVQELRKKNVKSYNRDSPTGNKTDYIFSGLLHCTKCGRRFCGKHSKGKHYYRCKNARTTLCNNSFYVSESKLEKDLVENITFLIEREIERVNIEKIGASKKIEDFGSKKNSIKKRMNKLSAMYLDEMINDEYYKKEYSTLKSELEVLDNLSKKEPDIDIKKLENFLKLDWKDMYNSLSNREKRTFWMSIIDQIDFESKEKYNVKLKLN